MNDFILHFIVSILFVLLTSSLSLEGERLTAGRKSSAASARRMATSFFLALLSGTHIGAIDPDDPRSYDSIILQLVSRASRWYPFDWIALSRI